VILRTADRWSRDALLRVAGGMALAAGGDLLYNVQVLEGTYHPGTLVDLWWVASYSAVAWGVVAAVGAPVVLDGTEVQVGGSVGVSLAYLQRFPVDVLKIDRAFVARVAGSGSDAALARAVIALGEALALRTVAEGIESVAQEQQLRARELRPRAGLPLRPPA
jgi:hypothetical protein